MIVKPRPVHVKAMQIKQLKREDSTSSSHMYRWSQHPRTYWLKFETDLLSWIVMYNSNFLILYLTHFSQRFKCLADMHSKLSMSTFRLFRPLWKLFVGVVGRSRRALHMILPTPASKWLSVSTMFILLWTSILRFHFVSHYIPLYLELWELFLFHDKLNTLKPVYLCFFIYFGASIIDKTVVFYYFLLLLWIGKNTYIISLIFKCISLFTD